MLFNLFLITRENVAFQHLWGENPTMQFLRTCNFTLCLCRRFKRFMGSETTGLSQHTLGISSTYCGDPSQISSSLSWRMLTSLSSFCEFILQSTRVRAQALKQEPGCSDLPVKQPCRGETTDSRMSKGMFALSLAALWEWPLAIQPGSLGSVPSRRAKNDTCFLVVRLSGILGLESDT